MKFIRLSNMLPDSPKVAKFARICRVPQDVALGLMVRWLCWVDRHCTDACTGLLPKELDQLVFGSVADLTNGLMRIGWVELDGDGCVCVAEFEKYCSPTAKRRIADTAKKRKQRFNNKENKK